MKMYTRIALSFFIVTVFLSACKEDDTLFTYASQGIVKGTIQGTSLDTGDPVGEDFRYTQYSTLEYTITHSSYAILDDGRVAITINRTDMQTGGGIELFFALENELDTTPDNTDVYLFYYKEYQNTLFKFEMYTSLENTVEVNDFSFNIGTGKVTGTFRMEGADNSTENNAVVEGSFDVTVKKLPVYIGS